MRGILDRRSVGGQRAGEWAEVWGVGYHGAMRRNIARIVGGFIGLILMVGGILGLGTIGVYAGPTAEVLVGGVVFGIVVLVGGWRLVSRFRRARQLQRWVAGGRCPRCGYDLRATPERCPECGMTQGHADRMKYIEDQFT